MRSQISICLMVFSACLARASAQPLPNKTLLDATNQIGEDVEKFLRNKKVTIRIGQFAGEGIEAERSSASPLLREGLRTSLLRHKNLHIVDGPADLVASGQFQAVEDPVTEQQAIILNVTLKDAKGANKAHFSGVITNEKGEKHARYAFHNTPDVAKVLGISALVPPKAPDKDQIMIIKDAVDKPKVHFDMQKRILAAKGAPFAMEVLVAPELKRKKVAGDYKVQAANDKNGLAHFDIKRGEAYGVRLYNLSDYEVAVDLRIDGLSMYHFSQQRDPKTGGPKFRYVVVPAKSHVEIRGWFVGLNDSDEFLVVPLEKSAVAKVNVGNPATIGTITALFHRAWDKKQGHPIDEPKNPNLNALSADATGRGQRFKQAYVEVDYEVGTFRGAITVRYTK